MKRQLKVYVNPDSLKNFRTKCSQNEISMSECIEKFLLKYVNDEITICKEDKPKISTLHEEYPIWAAIKDRCLNPNNQSYKYYGGRGIKIFIDWENSFESFFNYIGKRPSPKHSIDRIDVNGNYEPGNVRWATIKQQANNKRNSKKKEVK